MGVVTSFDPMKIMTMLLAVPFASVLTAQQTLPPVPQNQPDPPSLALKQSANLGSAAVLVAAGAAAAAGLLSASKNEEVHKTAGELAIAGGIVSIGLSIASQNRKRAAARRLKELGL